MSLREIIAIHVNASGPVSFASIFNYCKVQYSGDVEEYQVAKELTAMLQARQVELYDDGVSFNPGDRCHAEQSQSEPSDAWTFIPGQVKSDEMEAPAFSIVVNMEPIADIPPGDKAEEHARLLAAAPELLAALKELVFMTEGIAGLDDQQKTALEDARAALSKAQQ